MGGGLSTRVLCCLCVVLVVLQASSAPVQDLRRQRREPELSMSLAGMSVPDILARYNMENVLSNFTCSACKYAIKLLQDMFKSKMSFDAIAEAVAEVCYLAKIQDRNVCNGIAHTFKEEVLTVVSMAVLSPEEVCAGYMKDCGTEFDPFHQKWNISIPGGKPAIKPLPTPKDGAPVSRILQLTDIHYDPLYTEGLSNDCGEPLCCRPPNAKGKGKTAAGVWGDYKCDLPKRTVINLFENLKKMEDQFDWVYWTGDMVAHNVWNQTRTSTLRDLNYLYELFEKYLPNKTVFPSFGNHDTVPVNGFPQPFITGNQSMEWVVEPSIGSWSKWLSKFPNWTTTQSTIRKGGYYMVKVRQGLRVIALQTAYCEKNNFWLLVNATDPAGQLQWLVGQLLEAERVGDKVHILGHHPPGIYDSFQSCGDSYKDIVNRFESTIVGQFYGHTHTDTFHLYMDDSMRPTNVLYISPGATSYQGLNLGYRIYTVDGAYNTSTHAVLDHHNYIFDLHNANYNNSPEWTLEYSAKKAYNLTSMQPDSLYQFWKDMKESGDLLKLFNKHWHKSRQGLNYTANTGLLCEIMTTTQHQTCSVEGSLRNLANFYRSERLHQLADLL